MNNYFSTIGSKLSGESTPTRDYANYLTNINNQNSIFISPTSQEEILKITRELKPKTSKDTNEISTKLMKQTINTIISPITHIMNLSLSKGTVPDMMKISKTIPIHKSGDEHSLNNYRPISLLPTFSKILEKLM
jgi:Notch-like protein